MEKVRYVAKTMQGLEPVLAEELRQLGAENVEEKNRVVFFDGDKRMMYRANFCLRTALRILKPLATFQAESVNELYANALAYDWSEVMDLSKRFSIDSVVNSETFSHSRYAALKVKDAIVDQFRNRCGKRPFVDPDRPHVRIHLHIWETTCSLLLDSSGQSLHMRGYRRQQDVAPLNEVLAAGMVLTSGWRGECPFLDPMCGSGTLAIEAALIARGMAPGLFRQHYGFEDWPDFDPDLLEEVYNDDSMERECEVPIMGSDVSGKAMEVAQQNVKAAGLTKLIHLEKQSVFDLMPGMIPGVVITNPPYGERLKQFQLDSFYSQLGDVFKARYPGWDVWMLTGNRVAMKSFGLHPSKTTTLFNGPLECKYQRFSMYKGSLRDLEDEEPARDARPPREELGDQEQRFDDLPFSPPHAEDSIDSN
ncbi:MAG: RNA methyltransferase [Bacteroidia bacterium]|nr:MAG: RNA methyltransferase [Bacteroidia bacterium]